MDSEFLTQKEQECILHKAELLKVTERVEKTADAIKQVFSRQQGNVQIWRGTKLEISIGLDDLTLEVFEQAVPVVKKHLEEYHQLREQQKSLEKRLEGMGRYTDLDVVKKGG